VKVILASSAALASLPFCLWCGNDDAPSSIVLSCKIDYPYPVPSVVVAACARCARKGPPRCNYERVITTAYYVGIVVAIVGQLFIYPVDLDALRRMWTAVE
jgi:hypothetical protein